MIRKFMADDIDTVMQIWKHENIKAHSFISKEYWEKNFSYVKALLPNAQLYVYVIEDEIAGFIGLNGNYIEGIFVDSNHQKNGIGTALLNQAKEMHASLTLSAYQKNLQAVAFYKKNGFAITREGVDENTNEIEYTMLWSA